MSHDLYASWATAELSRVIKTTPQHGFDFTVNPSILSVYANRESGRVWPIPDGRISLEVQPSKFELAIELKRRNEGLHGVLTAIGQAHAYLHKGYSGSAIIVPDAYDSYDNPGAYVAQVIAHYSDNLPIGVFSYQEPDMGQTSPFFNRLTCHRPIGLNNANSLVTGSSILRQKTSTQWAHVREGSTESHAFFKYLQIAKQLNSSNLVEPIQHLPIDLVNAANNLNPKVSALQYLSNSPNSSFHDTIWRHFWFNNILTESVATIWQFNGHIYTVNNQPTQLKLSDGTYQVFFSARSDSTKQKLVADLNSGKITEEQAWEQFAQNVSNRAHSYREDIDSGLEHLGFIESDGRPSDLGYNFVDACERTNDCHSGKPWLIFGAALLKNGSFGAFLHYIYKVSEEKFKTKPLAITTQVNNKFKFDRGEYVNFIREELSNRLNVMNTASLRGGKGRIPFQAEFSILRKFGFDNNFRLGVGLEINWPLVQEFLDIDL